VFTAHFEEETKKKCIKLSIQNISSTTTIKTKTKKIQPQTNH